MENDNRIFVGKKPTMNYVLAVVTQFNAGQKDVHIEARGQSISKAVDVAEIARKRFIEDLKIQKIDIGTEKMKNEEDQDVNVSTITISLEK